MITAIHKVFEKNFEPVSVKCRICRQPVVVEVDMIDIAKWQNGMLIQNAMPYLTADEREMFISGTCSDCWDKLFPESDEDELTDEETMV
jgi:hypothetical protein